MPHSKTILPLVSFEDFGGAARPDGAPRAFHDRERGTFHQGEEPGRADRSLAILLARGRNARLVLYGEGREEDPAGSWRNGWEFRDRRISGISPGLGRSARRRFVLPSLNEGLCIVALEAMSRGVPVIATRVGGLQDYGPPAKSLLLPSARVDLVADAVDSHWDEALRNSMRKAGLRMVLERYSHDRVTEDYAPSTGHSETARDRRPA